MANTFHKMSHLILRESWELQFGEVAENSLYIEPYHGLPPRSTAFMVPQGKGRFFQPIKTCDVDKS